MAGRELIRTSGCAEESHGWVTTSHPCPVQRGDHRVQPARPVDDLDRNRPTKCELLSRQELGGDQLLVGHCGATGDRRPRRMRAALRRTNDRAGNPPAGHGDPGAAPSVVDLLRSLSGPPERGEVFPRAANVAPRDRVHHPVRDLHKPHGDTRHRQGGTAHQAKGTRTACGTRCLPAVGAVIGSWPCLARSLTHGKGTGRAAVQVRQASLRSVASGDPTRTADTRTLAREPLGTAQGAG